MNASTVPVSQAEVAADGLQNFQRQRSKGGATSISIGSLYARLQAGRFPCELAPLVSPLQAPQPGGARAGG